ncbi:MAG: 30S ribosomal protein S2 [Pseudomonadota bacterium]
MALPDFSMRQLLEAGVHFGHQTHRWNPKMDTYIFGKRNNIHILDLSQTVPLLHTALKQISDTVARGGRVLFVGTKRQASELVADAARRSAQYYVNARWLGGMLTNWKTISNSIKRLRELEELLASDQANYTKKELLNLTRERDKLERALGGIKDMGGTPDLIFVIDTNKESIAIQEARKLKIPVCAILDSNSDTSHIDLPIPGNDDAARAIALYCDLVAKAALDGIARQQGGSGVDLGAQVEAPQETVLEDLSAEAPAADATPVADMAAEAAAPEAAAAAPAAPLFTAPEGEGDDLTDINGIGPVAKTQLNEQGITTFKQIAELTSEDIQRVDDYMPFSSEQITSWKTQAAEKLAG